MEIRIRETGNVMTEQEFRSMFPNTGFPAQLTEAVINDFGGDVVFEGPQATGGEFWQYSVRDGVIQIKDKWYTNYSLGPKFESEEERDKYIAQKTAERIASTQNQILEATQKRLDDFAATRYYNSILSACTYATSAVPQFKSDGQYCVNARDMTWGKLYEMLGEVQAGKRPMPASFAAIEPELPKLEWPA